jgi:geranylgeranyl reductase family protein
MLSTEENLVADYDFDLVIVGGSANGSQAAYSSAKAGLRVAIIEEHGTTGLPEHCSGLFSYWGLDLLDSMPPESIIFNKEIYGSRIISPQGSVMTVRKDAPHALVSDRAAFDRFLLDRAVSLGATLYQPFRAIDVVRRNGVVETTITNSNGEKITLVSPLFISAEGIRATMAEKLGLKGPDTTRFVNAAQFYMYGLNDVDKELVEVYQTHQFAPDFFAWLIPMSDDSAKIGLGTSRKAASKELEKLVKEHPVMKLRCDGSEIRRKTAGRIPTTGPVKRTYGDNVMLVGDVAGQTKPTTGGGVILGGRAGQIAGEVAAESILAGDYSVSFLKRYQKQWRREMFLNLKLMGLVRNYMNELKDHEVDNFFGQLEKKGILSDVERYGHVDDQGTLVKKFMTTLSLYPFYLKTSGRLIKSILRT